MVLVEQDLIILPGGLHVWGREAALSGVPGDRVERQSQGHALHLMESPGWKKLSTDKVMVMGDVPDQALKTLAVTAEELLRMLDQQIGGPEQRYIYKIRIFDKREDFCNYARACGAGNALSLYYPHTMEMAVQFGPNTSLEDFEQTYAHEFVHAYMDLVYQVTSPLWFAEGMAEYFSHVRWTTRGYRPTKKNWRAMMHLGGEKLFSLSEIVNAGRNAIYGFEFPLYYAQCWSVVHFLLHKHPDVIEGLLKRETFDISLLSDEYNAYLKKLTGN